MLLQDELYISSPRYHLIYCLAVSLVCQLTPSLRRTYWQGLNLVLFMFCVQIDARECSSHKFTLQDSHYRLLTGNDNLWYFSPSLPIEWLYYIGACVVNRLSICIFRFLFLFVCPRVCNPQFYMSFFYKSLIRGHSLQNSLRSNIAPCPLRIYKKSTWKLLIVAHPRTYK